MASFALQRIKNEISSCAFDKINNIYFDHLAKKLSVTALQTALQESSSNSHMRLALSLLMIDQNIGGARPYLTVYDELISKGINEAALDFLYKFKKINPWHPLVIGRLINRFYASKDFPEIFSLLDHLPARHQESILGVNGVRRIIVDISKFLLCDTLLIKLGGFSEEVEWITEQKRSVAQYSLQDVPALISAEDFGLAQKLLSYLYSSGIRTPEFFHLAVSPMKSELDINARVLFFRIEAEKHCIDSKISELAAKSYLHLGEVEKAFNVVRRAIVKRCYSEQIIYLLTRIMTLLGRPLDDLLLAGFFGMPDYAKVSSFIRTSAVKMNTNSGRFIESDFLGTGLTHQNSAWSSSTSSTMTTRAYRKGRVALCLSGQIRGLDENYKNILNVKNSINDCDIFIDTWSKGRLTFPRFTRVQRYLGNDLWALLPDAVKMPDGFRKLFPGVTNIISNPLEININETYLKTYFPDAEINIECEYLFEKMIDRNDKLRHRGSFNQAKMFYKIYNSNELLKKSNKYSEYDVVIRWRPDLDINIDDLQSYIEDVSSDKNLIYTSYATAVGYGDQFAIGSKEAMDIYSSLWQRITDSGSFSYENVFDENSQIFAGEALLANHLIFNGLSVKVAKPRKNDFTTSLAINMVDIEHALIKDLSNNGLHDDMKAFMSHFSACKANNIRFK
jgi:hypothetical protein